jgi:hypothetical protein
MPPVHARRIFLPSFFCHADWGNLPNALSRTPIPSAPPRPHGAKVDAGRKERKGAAGRGDRLRGAYGRRGNRARPPKQTILTPATQSPARLWPHVVLPLAGPAVFVFFGPPPWASGNNLSKPFGRKIRGRNMPPVHASGIFLAPSSYHPDRADLRGAARSDSHLRLCPTDHSLFPAKAYPWPAFRSVSNPVTDP